MTDGTENPKNATEGWLILQRLDDLRRGQDDLAARMGRLEDRIQHLDQKIENIRLELDRKIESVRSWSIGILAILVLGFLAKLFFPSL